MSISPTINDLSLLQIDRMADDLRRGQPVILSHDDAYLVLAAAEFASTALLIRLGRFGDRADIVMTCERARSLMVANKGWQQIRVDIEPWMKPVEIQAVADPTLDLAMPFKGPFLRRDHTPGLLEEAAIKLLKLARLLPTGLVVDVIDPARLPDELLQVGAAAVLAADSARASALQKVAEASVPLEGAARCRLVSFRAESGGIEHMALIVDSPSPSRPVLTRLHSECFTGDLLGSLKCDCGQQLKGAVKAMADAGGGIVLYMAQEGRGIGLISKLKAYALQDQGYDTVDANTRLGFDVDERLFQPAAVMLQKLGFSSVRLMTNNPEKVDALSRFGIEVVERVQHRFPPNPHNRGYLDTKKARTGHDL